MAAAGIAVASTAALANDSLLILQTGGQTGFTRVIADQYAGEYRKHYKNVEAVTPGGCLPVMASIKDNKGPVLVVWETSVLPNDTCREFFTKQKPLVTFGGFSYLCTAKDSNLTVEDFAAGRGKVAISIPFPFWDKWFKDLGAHLGVQYQGVPVGDTGKMVLSLLSKETDWSVLNGQRALAQMKDNKLKCVASLNPNGESGLPYLGKFVKNFPNSQLLLGTNAYVANANAAEKKKIEEILINIHKTQEFQDFLLKGMYIDYTLADPVTKDKFYNNMVRVMSGK